MNYVREVAETFLAQCGAKTILGPTDFATIAEWEKQDIPLSNVLDTITEACRQSCASGQEITSITAIQNKVKEDYVRWLQSKDIQSPRLARHSSSPHS